MLGCGCALSLRQALLHWSLSIGGDRRSLLSEVVQPRGRSCLFVPHIVAVGASAWSWCCTTCTIAQLLLVEAVLLEVLVVLACARLAWKGVLAAVVEGLLKSGIDADVHHVLGGSMCGSASFGLG